MKTLHLVILYAAGITIGVALFATLAEAAIVENGIYASTSTPSATTVTATVALDNVPDSSAITICGVYNSAGDLVTGVTGSLSGSYTFVGKYNTVGTSWLSYYYQVAAGDEDVTAFTSGAAVIYMICQPFIGLETPYVVDFATSTDSSTTAGNIQLSRTYPDSRALVFTRTLNSTSTTADAGLTTIYSQTFTSGATMFISPAGTATPETYSWTNTPSGNIGSIGAYLVSAPEAPEVAIGGATSTIEQTQANLATSFAIFLFSFFGVIWLLRKH